MKVFLSEVVFVELFNELIKISTLMHTVYVEKNPSKYDNQVNRGFFKFFRTLLLETVKDKNSRISKIKELKSRLPSKNEAICVASVYSKLW